MSADGEAFGSCTSAPSVAFGPSIGPPSPPLPPLSPTPPTLWILVPSLTLSVALLVSYFPRRSSVCRGGCLGKQTGERGLREPDGMLRISVCPGLIPVPGKVFLRGAQRGLKLNGGTATQISAPPLPGALSVLPPPVQSRGYNDVRRWCKFRCRAGSTNARVSLWRKVFWTVRIGQI